MSAIRIESLTLQGVRCFADPFTATFAADGLTVVQGPNESGKTTLLAGIGAALFGVPAQDLEDWRRDPTPDACCGTLVLRTPDGTYTVTRDFSTHYVRVLATDGSEVLSGDGNPRGRTADTRRYHAWLRDHLGFYEREVFEETAFLRLREHDGLDYGDTVRELVSGAGAQDFSAVEEDLAHAFKELTCENPWGPRLRKDRRIEALREEVDNRRAVLAEAEAASARRRAVVEALETANRDRRAAQEQAKHGQDAVQRLRRVQDLRRQQDAAQQTLERCVTDRDRAADLDEAVATLTARLDDEFSDVATVSEADLTRVEAAAAAGAAAEQAKRDAMAIPAPEHPPTFAAGPAVLAGGLALALAVVLAVLRSPGAGIALAGAGLAVACALYVHARRRYFSAAEAYDTALVRKTTSDADAVTALREADALLAQVPEALRGQSAEAVRARMHERELAEQALQHKQSERAQLPGTDALHAAVRDGGVILATVQGNLETLGAAHVSSADVAEQLHAAERHITATQRAAVAAAEQRDQALRAQGEMNATTFPAVAVLCEEIADREDQLQTLELRRDALQVAVETLRDAAHEFQRDHVGPIAEEATGLFRAFTREGWEVRLAQENLAPQVQWQGRPWVVERLSAGTQDQLAVALRLAVVRALRGRIRLPLILDDPLAHWDAARRAAFRETLQELARTHQVILATPDGSVATWGQAAVRLGG